MAEKKQESITLIDPARVAQTIDHTLLRADAGEADVLRLIEEARIHGFYSVCLNSTWLPLAVREVAGSSVLPITVVGFPLGANLTAAKAAETEAAVKVGAREIDMVINLGALKGGERRAVQDDIAAVVKAAQTRPVKVILETCYLNDAEIVEACKISEEAGAAFVKTSTGFGSGGATVEHVRLMRASVSPRVQVKASGGIRSFANLRDMIGAGATRIGASASVSIVAQAFGGKEKAVGHGY